MVGESDFNENPVVSLDLDFDLGFVKIIHFSHLGSFLVVFLLFQYLEGENYLCFMNGHCVASFIIDLPFLRDMVWLKLINTILSFEVATDMSINTLCPC